MKTLPVKLVITDIVQDETHKQIRSAIGAIASSIIPHPFGLFHTALIVGLFSSSSLSHMRARSMVS